MLAEMILSGYLTTTDNQRISYDYYKSNHDKVLIIAPGFFNSKSAVLMKELARSLSNEYDVIVFDFRGHGKSSGLFYWTSKEYVDLQAVLDYSHKTYKKIGVIGFSFGGATSIITASKSNLIQSLVCVSAPSEVEKVDYRLWELDFENDIRFGFLGEGGKGKGVCPGPWWQKKEKPIDVVDKIKIPIMYIHGDKDWVVKEWHSEKLYEKTKSYKKIIFIKNGPHAEYLMRKYKQDMVEAIKSWFKETL